MKAKISFVLVLLGILWLVSNAASASSQVSAELCIGQQDGGIEKHVFCA